LDKSLEADDRKTLIDTTWHILGTGFWPLHPPTTPFTPPQVIVQTYERFARFYVNKHAGRKLTWLWQLCKGEMKANYCKVQGGTSKVAPTFQVSIYQMAILLLFNDSDTHSYEETLDPYLGVFIKAKVLLAQPEGAKPESGTIYKLNTAFKTKKAKINLNIGIKSEQKQEVEDTHKTIEEDRKLLVQVSTSSIYFLLQFANNSLVGHCAYHEVPEEDEASATRLRNDPADQEPLHASGSGHQEVYRHPPREGVSRTSRRRRAWLSRIDTFSDGLLLLSRMLVEFVAFHLNDSWDLLRCRGLAGPLL
jgi:hypothetical protein